MERLPQTMNPRVPLSTKLREFVLFIEADFHNPPGRLLAIWLDGEVEFETSDGERRRVPAGTAVLVEDTHEKGISRAIHGTGKMLYRFCCRVALTRPLHSRLLPITGKSS